MTQKISPELHYHGLWLFIGYALLGLIIYLSVTSVPVDLDLDFPYQDKFSHMLAYFVLMGWFAQIYQQQKKRIIYAALFIATGAILEYVQSFDPVRMAEFADMVANSTGVLIALLLARYTGLGYLLYKLEMLLIKSEK